MGLPDGHVTDVPGITRNAQLKALGNGVVPAQAAAAFRVLLPALLGEADGIAQPLPRTATTLLPTPTAGDAKSSRNSTAARHKIPPTGIHAGNTLTDILVPSPGADQLRLA